MSNSRSGDSLVPTATTGAWCGTSKQCADTDSDDTTRCYTPEENGGNVKQVKGKYKLINKETGKVYKQYYRKPKRKDWSASWIQGKRRETEGKLQVVIS